MILHTHILVLLLQISDDEWYENNSNDRIVDIREGERVVSALKGYDRYIHRDVLIEYAAPEDLEPKTREGKTARSRARYTVVGDERSADPEGRRKVHVKKPDKRERDRESRTCCRKGRIRD